MSDGFLFQCHLYAIYSPALVLFTPHLELLISPLTERIPESYLGHHGWLKKVNNKT